MAANLIIDLLVAFVIAAGGFMFGWSVGRYERITRASTLGDEP